MRKKMLLLVMFLFWLSSPALAGTDTVESLRNDLESLRQDFQLLQAETQNVEHKTSNLMDLSGYADLEYIINNKSGTPDGFRVHHLSLFFKKRVSDNWRFFSEVEYEDAPKVDAPATIEGKIFIEVFTIEYLHSPLFNLRGGRFLTPGGIWNVEHYPPFVATQERPQHIRKIFPQLNDGLQLFGTVTTGDIVTDYILYASNGSGNTGNGDTNDNKALGGRLKFKLPLLGRTEIGLSAYSEKDNADTDLTAYGADLNLSWSNFRFQAEYATGAYDKATGTDYDRKGYYGQLTYIMGDYDLIYRYDWYDSDTSAANKEKTVNTLAFNYHFSPAVVGKVEHHRNDEEDPAKEDYEKTILSVAIYLGE